MWIQIRIPYKDATVGFFVTSSIYVIWIIWQVVNLHSITSDEMFMFTNGPTKLTFAVRPTSMKQKSTESSSLTMYPSTKKLSPSPSFPMWGDYDKRNNESTSIQGIDFKAILSYLQYEKLPENQDMKKYNILYPPDRYPKKFSSPNILYVFGGMKSMYQKQQDTKNNNHHHDMEEASSPFVWVDNGIRQHVRTRMVHGRLEPNEQLLKDALNHLIRQSNFDATDIKSLNSWKRLKHVIFNEKVGIPFLAYLDDNRQCPHQNFIYNGNTYDLPLFTLAVANPALNYCNYSFPLPTYKTIAFVKELQKIRTNANDATTDSDRNTVKATKASSSSSSSSSPMMQVWKEQEKQYPWHSKIPTVVWRGMNSGMPRIPYHSGEYNSSHKHFHNEFRSMKLYPKDERTYPMRLQMVLQSMTQMQKYNQSISTTNLLSNSTTATATTTTTTAAAAAAATVVPIFDIGYVCGKVRRTLPDKYKEKFPQLEVKTRILPMQEFQKYKANIDVDGNSWSERFGKLLCMNSVLLKVEPEFVDYLWPTVQPWVHYVPVLQNSSDLLEKAKYVMDPKNDKQMRRIVYNANKWCEENMQYEKLLTYVLDAMAYYVKMLDQHNIDWIEEWKNVVMNNSFHHEREWQPLQ